MGRTSEKALVRRILRGAHEGKVALLGLWGMGGSGKTTLGLEVGNELKEQFSKAQLFFDLRGTSKDWIKPEAIMEEVIRCFRPRSEEPPTDSAALRRDYLAVLTGEPALLVLDNARDADQVRPLLPPKGCGLIVTSRYSLNSLTEIKSIPLGLMTESESVKLLRVRMTKGGDKDELKRLAKLCDYLPLALDVAGSFLHGHPEWTISSYIEALERWRLDWLKFETDEARNVKVVLGFSAAQLVREDPELAARWQELSVLEADFEERFAAAVLDHGSDSLRAKAVLAKLRERSLVLLDANNRRYRLHDLIQEVAAKVFDYETHSLGSSSGERLTAARRRSKTYCEDLLIRLNDALSAAKHEGSKKGIESLKSELENLPAALASMKTAFDRGKDLDTQDQRIMLESLDLIGQTLDLAFTTKDLTPEQREQLNIPVVGEACWMIAQVHAEYIGDLASGRKFANWALGQFCKSGDRRIKEVRDAIRKWRKPTRLSKAFDRQMQVVMERVAIEMAKEIETTHASLEGS